MRLERNSPLWLIVLAVTSLMLMIMHNTGRLTPVEGAVLRVLTPAQKQLTNLGNSVRDLIQTARDLKELRQRNAELQALNDKLTIENVRLREIEAEYYTLRELLKFNQANPTYTFRTAQVIGRDPSNLWRYIIIDVGQRDGIRPNMPVVTHRGLVGRVREVYPTASQVQLILDPASSVSALDQASRAPGLVEGEPGGSLGLHMIPQGETVNVGDIILTSGLGGHFPKNLVIGQVTAVHQQDIEMFQRASIRPTVDFNKLEIVQVITNFERTPERVQP